MASRRPADSTRKPEPAPAVAPAEKAAERPRATRAKKSAAPVTRAEISAEDRRQMIAEGAYLRAERRGFAPGSEQEDWLAAEAEVDALLKAGHGTTPQ